MGKCYEYTNDKGKVYYLHYVDLRLRSGINQRIYYFKQNIDKNGQGAPCELPEDRELSVNPRTGFPVTVKKLRRGGGQSTN